MTDEQRLGLGFIIEQFCTFVGQTILNEQKAASEKAALTAENEALKKRVSEQTPKEG